MVPGMKALGKMTYSMDKGKKHGLTGLSMKGNTWEAKNMVKVYIVGMMVQGMEENGTKIK